ncbi:hypothetical protein [Phenylobacterium sp.]|uniref:hypothetical protein n=1 Tax=Phenylobacterium sp. TaxID=1871053 RepID=UPI0025E67580|nr:hypothetical protein [Phenylobacterium sp.]
MASEHDDNPFARNSAWPKMPQAPFRVGPLPKGQPAAPALEPKPQAATTITPAFVRPTGAVASSGLASGGAVPRAAPQTQPQPPQPSAPAVPLAPVVDIAAPPASEAQPVEPSTPEARPEPYVEIAPIIVQPLGSGARKTVRKSPVPAIAATAAGLAAILGIAYALNRGQEEALKRAASQPAAVIAAPAAPQPPAPETVSPVPAPPATAVAPANSPPRPQVASRPLARTSASPQKIDLPAPAAETGVAEPAISLPTPPSRVVVPEPTPLPSYTPPAAPDPTAPVSNQRRD